MNSEKDTLSPNSDRTSPLKHRVLKTNINKITEMILAESRQGIGKSTPE